MEYKLAKYSRPISFIESGRKRKETYFTEYLAVCAALQYAKGNHLSVSSRTLSLRLYMCVCVCMCVFAQLINSTFVPHVRQFRVQFTPFSVAVVRLAAAVAVAAVVPLLLLLL